MTGRHYEIGAPAGASDVGEAVGRNRTQSAPWLYLLEIGGRKFRIVPQHRIDDAAHANGADVLVQPGNFHRAAESQRAHERRDSQSRFGEYGAEPRRSARPRQGEAVALAGLQRQFEIQAAREPRGPRSRAQHEFVRLYLRAITCGRGTYLSVPLHAPAVYLGVP